MKIIKKNRLFKVGKKKNIILKDVGHINLKINENVTFKNNKSKEYDICRKKWGYYLTPSLNKRLIKFGYLTALVFNKNYNTYFIHLVDKEKKSSFLSYLKSEDMDVVCWLNKKKLENIRSKI